MSNHIIPISAFTAAIVLIAILGSYIAGAKFSGQSRVEGISTELISPLPAPSLITSSVTVSQSTSSALNSPAEGVFDSFYSWYVGCIKTSGNICDYQKRSEINQAQLSQNLQTRPVTGFDPIICTQNPPDVYRVDRIDQNNSDKATGYIVEGFTSGSQIQLLVEAQKQGNDWKITNIICPRS